MVVGRFEGSVDTFYGETRIAGGRCARQAAFRPPHLVLARLAVPDGHA